MKARPAEAFLCFLPAFSIQLANSQFQAKYGILPTGAAAWPYPGFIASYPSRTLSRTCSRFDSQREDISSHVPTRPHCLDQATYSIIHVKSCVPGLPWGYYEWGHRQWAKSSLEAGRSVWIWGWKLILRYEWRFSLNLCKSPTELQDSRTKREPNANTSSHWKDLIITKSQLNSNRSWPPVSWTAGFVPYI